MDDMERDPLVVKWTRHHDIRIPYRKWWGGKGFYEPDFLIETADGNKELREVKGNHLFRDANTGRKLRAGDAFCRNRGMKFRVVTKGLIDPQQWVVPQTVSISQGDEGVAVKAPAQASIVRRALRWVLGDGD